MTSITVKCPVTGIPTTFHGDGARRVAELFVMLACVHEISFKDLDDMLQLVSIQEPDLSASEREELQRDAELVRRSLPVAELLAVWERGREALQHLIAVTADPAERAGYQEVLADREAVRERLRAQARAVLAKRGN
jgi:hypothetical protein